MSQRQSSITINVPREILYLKFKIVFSYFAVVPQQSNTLSILQEGWETV